MKTPRRRQTTNTAKRLPLPAYAVRTDLLPADLVHWFKDPNFSTALASFSIGLLDAAAVAKITSSDPQDQHAGLRWLTHALRDALPKPSPSPVSQQAERRNAGAPFRQGDRVRVPEGRNSRGLSGVLYVSECVLRGPSPEKPMDWTVAIVGKKGARGCGYYNASLFELVRRDPARVQES